MLDKNKVYRFNKNNGKLYFYDIETKERGLATTEEYQELRSQEIKEAKEEIEKLKNRILFVTAMIIIILSFKKNQYSNYEKLETSITCLLNENDKSQILNNKVKEYINNKIIYNKKEYEQVYNYLFASCSDIIKPDDLIGIFEIISRDISYHQKENPFIYSCMQSILQLNNSKYSGDMSLSIISDILGKERTVYLILTNQETRMRKELMHKLQLSEREIIDFLFDLKNLNRLSQNKYDFSNYSNITQRIIESSVKIPVEKMLLRKIVGLNKKEFIPARNFLNSIENDYPVCIKNDYFNSVIIVVDKNFEYYDSLPTILNTHINNTIESQYNEENALLPQYFQDKMTKETEAFVAHHLSNIDLNFRKYNIHVRNLIVGLKNRDTQSFKRLLDTYFNIWLKEEIDEKSITELIVFLKYMSFEIEREEENQIAWNYLLNNFVANVKEACQNQNKSEYISLINQKDLILYYNEFNYIFQEIQFPSYEIHPNIKSNEAYWEIVIPKEEKDVVPTIKIINHDNTSRIVELNEFTILEMNRNNESYDIYNLIKKPEEKEIEVSVSLNKYLETKNKNVERLKYLR